MSSIFSVDLSAHLFLQRSTTRYRHPFAEFHYSTLPFTHDRHVETCISGHCWALIYKTCHHICSLQATMPTNCRWYPYPLLGWRQWRPILTHRSGWFTASSWSHQRQESSRNPQTRHRVLSWSSWQTRQTYCRATIPVRCHSSTYCIKGNPFHLRSELSCSFSHP